MKERPILFSGLMVRAILEGRKTQTRRVIKKPEPWQIEFNGEGHFAEDIYGESYNVLDVCPYGKRGDRLWVRETWRPFYDPYWLTSIQYKADMAVIKPTEWETESAQYGMWCEENTGDIPGEGGQFKPSIHMPRCFSRITLEITNIRVERLQDISNDDACDEGVELNGHVNYIFAFQDLWNQINGKPRKDGVDISWAANPWVWVVSFQRLENKEGGAE